MQGPVVRVFRPGAFGRQRPDEQAKYTALVKISTADFWSRRQNAMLVILLAQSCAINHGFVPYSALNGPKSDPSFWGDPLEWHSFFGHSFRFRNSVFASSSRRRGLGKGTAFESPSPATL